MRAAGQIAELLRRGGRQVAELARRAWPRRDNLDDVPEFEGELTPREKQEQAIQR
jgi:hypothetical protein